MNLTKLLKPKSVAVIGASEKEGFGGDVCRNTLSYVEDMSRVYFVHPKRERSIAVNKKKTGCISLLFCV